MIMKKINKFIKDMLIDNKIWINSDNKIFSTLRNKKK
jgi:hypothetical protein